MGTNSENYVDFLFKDFKKITRKGYPDRLYYKLNKNGKILKSSIKFIEIKYRGSKLSKEQKIIKEIFLLFDLPYEIKKVTSLKGDYSKDFY